MFSDLKLRNRSIIQEFIENPLLIDGRKFSIGVYVMFSSAKPLRAYIHDSILTLRFSPKVYDAEKLHDNPRMYVTDGMEYGVEFIRQVRFD